MTSDKSQERKCQKILFYDAQEISLDQLTIFWDRDDVASGQDDNKVFL